MIGKLISALAGKQIAAHTPGLSEGQGALVGLAAATVMRRLGPTGMVVAAVGGWAVSRYMQKRQTRPGQPSW